MLNPVVLLALKLRYGIWKVFSYRDSITHYRYSFCNFSYFINNRNLIVGLFAC